MLEIGYYLHKVLKWHQNISDKNEKRNSLIFRYEKNISRSNV